MQSRWHFLTASACFAGLFLAGPLAAQQKSKRIGFDKFPTTTGSNPGSEDTESTGNTSPLPAAANPFGGPTTFSPFGERQDAKLEFVRQLTGHNDAVMDLAVSRNSEQLLSSDNSHQVTLWRIESGTPLTSHRGTWPIGFLDQRGRHFSHNMVDKSVKGFVVWDSISKKPYVYVEHQQHIRHESYTSNRIFGHSPETGFAWTTPARSSSTSLESDYYSQCSIYDLSTGRVLFRDRASDLRINRNGRFSAMRRNNAVIVTELETKRIVGQVNVPGVIELSQMDVSPSGGELAIRTSWKNGDASFLLYEVKTGKLLASHHSKKFDAVPAAIPVWFHFVGRDRIIGAFGTVESHQCQVRLWNPRTGENVVAFPTTLEIGRDLGHRVSERIIGLDVSGKYASVMGNEPHVFDMAGGRVFPIPKGRHAARVTSLVVSPDGKYVFTGSEDRTIGVWKLPDGGESEGTVAGTSKSPAPTDDSASTPTKVESTKTPAKPAKTVEAAERTASAKLRLAEQLLKRKRETALQRLREIVENYPDTEAAEKARKILGE